MAIYNNFNEKSQFRKKYQTVSHSMVMTITGKLQLIK